MVLAQNYIESEQVVKPVRFTFTNLFKRWMWRFVIVSTFLQCVLFPSFENIFASLCVLIAWKATDVIVLTKYNLSRFTFSTVIILGYSLTQYCLPLIFTLLEGKPLIFNLKLPFSVFIHSMLAFAIFILTHEFYKNWKNSFGKPISRNANWILRQTNFFTPPTDFQIWVIAAIGLAGITATFITSNHYDGTEEERSSFAKFLQGLIPYAYAPFFILLRPIFENKSLRLSKRTIISILIYTLLLLLVSVGGNSRGLFMKGITAVGISYLIGLMLGKFEHNIFTIKNFTLAFLGIWIITGPLSDLGTAMIIVRAQRSDISSADLIQKTLISYQDKDAIQAHLLNSKTKVKEWDETYFDNIFLARFCNLKYNDASLELAEKIGSNNDEVYNFSVDRVWSTIPKPILSLIQVDVDKEAVSSASFGDYLFHQAGGKNALGGFRTGHFAGSGMAAFGWWYLLLIGIGAIPLFFLVDLLVLFNRDKGMPGTYLSFVGLTSITTFFTFFSTSSNAESVVSIFTFLIRGFFQMVLIYWLVFFIVRKMDSLRNLLFPSSKRKEPLAVTVNQKT